MKIFEDIQIAVAGTGYVGLIATLLAQHHMVLRKMNLTEFLGKGIVK